MIISPTVQISNITVYLVAKQNGTLTTLPIYYQVTPKCYFEFPFGNSIKIQLDLNENAVKELIYSNYLHPASGTSC